MPRIASPVQTAATFAARFGDRPVSLAEVEKAGLTRGQVRAAVERRLIVRVRHGLYRMAPGVLPNDAVGASSASDDAPAWIAQHRADVRAALAAVGPDTFATHDSAAIAQRLPRPSSAPPELVTLARPGIQDFSGPGLVVRGSPIPSAFVTVVDGIPCTDVRRTAVDLARGRSLPAALVPLDGAARRLISAAGTHEGDELRRRVHDPELRRLARQEIAYAISACVGWPGIAAVRRALPFVEPAAESAFESRSRSWFLRAGLPPLEIGAEIRAGGRTYWADFCSRERRVIGEADGWGKYGTDLDSVRSRLTHEKQRQADLESDGWRVVRWTTQDSPADVVRRMRQALRSH